MEPLMTNNRYYEKDYVLARQQAERTQIDATARAAKVQQATDEVLESKRVLRHETDNSK